MVGGLIFTLLFSAGGFSTAFAAEKRKPAGAIALVNLPSTSPLITFRLSMRAGSAFDPAGKEGLASLTAKLVAEGGSQTLTYKELLKKLYPMAATINVQTDKELVTFIGEVHKDHLKPFSAMFTDTVLKPRFDQSEFDRLRDNAVNALEKTLRGTNDEELGKQALELEIFDGHPYGHAVGGTVRGLKSITLDDVKAFYAARYTRLNLMLGLAGDVPPAFVKQITDELASLPEGNAATLKAASPAMPDGLEVTFIEKNTPSTAISLGFPISVTRKDDDFLALLVANSYLGEHRTFNGILMRNMREKRGLNYGDYSYIEHFVQDGGSTFPVPNTPRSHQYFSIWIRPVPNEVRLFALRQAIWELDRLHKNGMSEKDFEATRKFLLNYSNLWVQTLSRRLGYKMDSRFYGIDDTVREVQARLPKLTLAQVNAAIGKYLNPQSFKVVMVTKDAEGLKAQMLSNAVSPMRYESATPKDVLDEDKEIEKHPLRVNERKLRIVPATKMFE